MFSKITNQTELAVVSLAEAKKQLNIIDSTEDDEHIQLLISAASELAEGYTNRLLSEATVQLSFSDRKSFFLPFGEAQNSPTPITVISGSKNLTFTFDDISQILTIDDNQISATDNVRVTYKAGYTSAPNSVKMGVLMIISSLFMNREDTSIGFTVADIPLDSRQILGKVKL
tara:strand:- start:524 stop:1039 length:516 start_codon:yes stop_codon:yes gene_type:complete